MDWIIVDENGWHLKEDAPEHIKKEYEKFNKEHEMYKEAPVE